MSRPDAICIMGPTASGKTGAAIRLLESLPVEIVSVDSAQVYRGMDIGSAKPDAETLRRAPHRLIDIRDPAEAYSAAEFRQDALHAMADIQHNGKVPLLVGGTMLYYQALFGGLSPLPSADPAVRARLNAEAEEQGWPALHRRLQQHDPQAAANIHPNDAQRIQRALEVLQTTGRPISQWQAGAASPASFRWLKLVLCPARRASLHERIAGRFESMLAGGFEDEMRRLHERSDLSPDLPSMRSVGYRQGWAYIDGETDREAFRRQTVAATRQLAKRQLTWLRAEPGTLWYDLETEDVYCRIFNEVEDFLELAT